MDYKDIFSDKRDGIAKITTNRPKQFNALTLDIDKEISDGFRNFKDDDDISFAA